MLAHYATHSRIVFIFFNSCICILANELADVGQIGVQHALRRWHSISSNDRLSVPTLFHYVHLSLSLTIRQTVHMWLNSACSTCVLDAGSYATLRHGWSILLVLPPAWIMQYTSRVKNVDEIGSDWNRLHLPTALLTGSSHARLFSVVMEQDTYYFLLPVILWSVLYNLLHTSPYFAFSQPISLWAISDLRWIWQTIPLLPCV